MNPRFLIFIMLLFVVFGISTIVDTYMKLYVVWIYMSLILFVIICAIAVLIDMDKIFYEFLKKSVFSKYIILLVVASYILGVFLTYYNVNQKLQNTELYSDIKKEFKRVSFNSTFQNALLLKEIVIVDIEDRINIEDIKQIIIKKYQDRDGLAFRFKLYGQEKNSYVIYNSKFVDIKISLILIYLLLAILVWGMNWIYRPSVPKWDRIKELVGILIVSFFIFGIGLTTISRNYWNSMSHISEKSILQSDIFFVKKTFVSFNGNNQYTIILKGD